MWHVKLASMGRGPGGAIADLPADLTAVLLIESNTGRSRIRPDQADISDGTVLSGADGDRGPRLGMSAAATRGQGMSGEAGGFGVLLRARRQSAGLSQQEVAERSGLAIRTISDLERGRTRWPYPDSVHRLADALELSGAPRAEFITAARRRLAGAAQAGSAGRAGSGLPREASKRVVPRLLPAAVPGFVGRRDQLAALTQVLHHPGRDGGDRGHRRHRGGREDRACRAVGASGRRASSPTGSST